MKKNSQNDLTLKELRKDIERLKKEQVKDYNKLWLMITDLKNKLKKL